MLNQFSRTELLLGKKAMQVLEKSRVVIFGVGGVGGYVAEALARSGLGCIDLVDDDKVCLTNINRQIIATRKTVGKYKGDVMKERILKINPNAVANTHKCFFLPETKCKENGFINFYFPKYALQMRTDGVYYIRKKQKAGWERKMLDTACAL